MLKDADEVLLVFQSPHPDIKMLKAVFETSDNIKLKAVTIDELKLSDLQKYQLAIFHGLPTTSSLRKLKLALRQPISRLFWLTKTSDLRGLQQLTKSIKIITRGEDLRVRPAVNPDVEVFNISEKLPELFNDIPEISVVYGDYIPSNQSKILLTQKVGATNTDNVMASVQLGDVSEGVFVGDGYWKMRLYWQMNEIDSAPFDSFLKSYVQLLLRTKQENRLLVNFTKDVYQTNERIGVQVEVFNKLFERQNDIPVEFIFENKLGEKKTFKVLSSEGKVYKFPLLNDPS